MRRIDRNDEPGFDHVFLQRLIYFRFRLPLTQINLIIIVLQIVCSLIHH